MNHKTLFDLVLVWLSGPMSGQSCLPSSDTIYCPLPHSVLMGLQMPPTSQSPPLSLINPHSPLITLLNHPIFRENFSGNLYSQTGPVPVALRTLFPERV